ncbi:cytochrome b/b6 domain-containing protein [uncultured Microbacterium sp.]|uniref:cytochrome b/b6 domain-containing protein n=1 Tax=uncultured Microbacterium sp. TaxID=191216 RepID=UPI0025FB90C3|nr:cytochrome b/b6 domain-containing protein [uncultured Microbacterium sp.]
MATDAQALRRGLPRTPGGEPWPPAGDAPVTARRAGAAPVAEAAAPVVAEAAPAAAAPAAEVSAAQPVAAPAIAPSPAVAPVAPALASATAQPVRRGLPRTSGGEPWPPASFAPAIAASAGAAPTAAAQATDASPAAVAPAPAASAPAAPVAAATVASETPLRRGLPRTAGGDPWPPAGFAPAAIAAEAAQGESAVATQTAASTPAEGAVATPATTVAATPEASVAAQTEAPVEVSIIDGKTPLVEPLPMKIGVFPGRYAFTPPAPKPEPQRIGPYTRGQWAGAAAVIVVGLLFVGAMAIFAVRWWLSTTWGQSFLADYPGEYHLPESAPVGFPAWLGWQHFFNVFLMVLIIRSGLQVRHQKKPPAFWSPRWNPKRKISINLWLHQSLDILWVLNGVVFIVLLFVTGQWMRLVPTSWEVFPNAFSAVLQYISLDWPTENGWVNYNSVQQIAYFTTVFIAAPLAIITGVRMSGFWPKDAAKLNKAYPIEWARAVHFPTMLYFVLFIVVHVTLVFATGALRNLNHMYAAQGSTDPNAYADNWAGAGIFAGSMLLIIAAWVAARPLVIAPIAKLFGAVSAR